MSGMKIVTKELVEGTTAVWDGLGVMLTDGGEGVYLTDAECDELFQFIKEQRDLPPRTSEPKPERTRRWK